MEIDILTGSILIGLFLTNVILIFLDSRQQSRFRQTEKRLQDALLEKIEEVEHLQHRHHQTEKHLQDKLLKKIEEVEHLQHRHHQTEKHLQDKLLKKIEEVEHLLRQYRTSTLFNYQSPWWQDYSWLYRHVRGWQCEECQLSLNFGSAVSAHAPHLRDTA